MTGYAAQLPVLVIADMLGVPLSDQALFKSGATTSPARWTAR
jgi:hypothetical protein